MSAQDLLLLGRARNSGPIAVVGEIPVLQEVASPNIKVASSAESSEIAAQDILRLRATGLLCTEQASCIKQDSGIASRKAPSESSSLTLLDFWQKETSEEDMDAMRPRILVPVDCRLRGNKSIPTTSGLVTDFPCCATWVFEGSPG
mmetsp:Transcript_63481/g.138263  ORF Transcript_63481/g.138263 Transcript_63481/m.138263 type:complete len:146 (+) Transcript_63481:230-667(+)